MVCSAFIFAPEKQNNVDKINQLIPKLFSPTTPFVCKKTYLTSKMNVTYTFRSFSIIIPDHSFVIININGLQN